MGSTLIILALSVVATAYFGGAGIGAGFILLIILKGLLG
jgi:hypothetical protein